MEFKKFFDKSKEKTIISEVDDEAPRSKAIGGYQSITSSTSFRKDPLSSHKEPPKEYNFKTVTDESGKTLKFRKAKDEPEEDTDRRQQFILDVSPDKMSATLMVFDDDEKELNEDIIMTFLHENRIVYGIDEEAVSRIVSGEAYYEDVTIAKGTPAVHGIDGYFDYTFNPTPETKPIILEDGSVDYNMLGKIELVYKDQLLATYIPLKEGTDGQNIYGEVIKAKTPVDLKPLKVNNADYDPSTFEYYSVIEGKATVENGTLKVTPVFVVEDNLEAATGDLNFHGDVIVKGNVFSNVTIKTTGNITINGHVEIATLIAGKDILLKNGMQGSGVGKIKCGGNLMAKFLEQTIVNCDGNIDTNAILNCEVISGKKITVAGTRGAILGGSVYAAEEIEAYSLGNRVGVTTKIVVGLETDFKIAVTKVDEEIEKYSDKYDEASRSFNKVMKDMQTSKNPALSKEKMILMRDKITFQSKLNDLKNQKDFLLDIRERSVDGKVLIHGPVNIGTTVIINGVSESVTTTYKNVTFIKTPKELRVKSNSIDDNAPRKKHR